MRLLLICLQGWPVEIYLPQRRPRGTSALAQGWVGAHVADQPTNWGSVVHSLMSSRHFSHADCRLTPSAVAISFHECPSDLALDTECSSAVSSRPRITRTSSS